MEEQYKHGIFVCSNYTSGKRKGLHYLFNETNLGNILDIMSKYIKKEGVSFYSITTNSDSIKSISEKDKFFNSIDIMDGAKPENVKIFDEALDNQIEILDLAFLLLSREPTTIENLIVYIFYCYMYHVKIFNRFPVKDKYYVGLGSELGFKKINEEFKTKDSKTRIRCSKANVVISKFFNCDNGTELMNNLLKIYYRLKEIDLDILKDKRNSYLQYILKTTPKKIKSGQPYITRHILNDTFNMLDVGIQISDMK